MRVTKGIALSALPLILASAALLLPPPAQASTSEWGVVSVVPGSPDVPKPGAGCVDVPYTVNVEWAEPNGLPLEDVWIDLDLGAPSGAVTEYNIEAVHPTPSRPGAFVMCSHQESGTYTISGVVQWWDKEYNTSGLLPLTPATFTFGAATPPPAGPVYTQVEGTLKKASYRTPTREFAAVVAGSQHQPLPNEFAVPVTWKLKVGSKTVRTLAQSWNETDQLAVRLPLKNATKTYRLRILEDGKKVFDKRYTVKSRRS